MDLEAANWFVWRTGERTVWEPVGVHPECEMLRLAVQQYDVPVVAVAQAAHYLQRIVEAHGALWAVTGWLHLGPPAGGGAGTARRDARDDEPTVLLRASRGDPKLMMVYAACVNIATKLLDRPQYSRQLSLMIRDVTGTLPSREAAEALEMACLTALEWRLGPRPTRA